MFISEMFYSNLLLLFRLGSHYYNYLLNVKNLMNSHFNNYIAQLLISALLKMQVIPCDITLILIII